MDNITKSQLTNAKTMSKVQRTLAKTQRKKGLNTRDAMLLPCTKGGTANNGFSSSKAMESHRTLDQWFKTSPKVATDSPQQQCTTLQKLPRPTEEKTTTTVSTLQKSIPPIITPSGIFSVTYASVTASSPRGATVIHSLTSVPSQSTGSIYIPQLPIVPSLRIPSQSAGSLSTSLMKTVPEPSQSKPVSSPEFGISGILPTLRPFDTIQPIIIIEDDEGQNNKLNFPVGPINDSVPKSTKRKLGSSSSVEIELNIPLEKKKHKEDERSSPVSIQKTMETMYMPQEPNQWTRLIPTSDTALSADPVKVPLITPTADASEKALKETKKEIATTSTKVPSAVDLKADLYEAVQNQFTVSADKELPTYEQVRTCASNTPGCSMLDQKDIKAIHNMLQFQRMALRVAEVIACFPRVKPTHTEIVQHLQQKRWYTRRTVEMIEKAWNPASRRRQTYIQQQTFEESLRKRIDTQHWHACIIREIGDPNNGKGVFAIQPIMKGEVVCDYHGELISHEEGLRRYNLCHEATSNKYFFFQSQGKKYCLDGNVPCICHNLPKEKIKGRMVNESTKEANLIAKVQVIDNRPHILMYAKHDIPLGCQLTISRYN